MNIFWRRHRRGARQKVGQVVRCTWFINHIECVFGEANSPSHQASAQDSRTVDPSKSLVIRSDEEPLPIEEVPQLEDSPHDAEAFSLRGGVVLLSSSESSAPIPDRVKQFARFPLGGGYNQLSRRMHPRQRRASDWPSARQVPVGTTVRCEGPRRRR